MAVINWPSTLPDCVDQEGYTETLGRDPVVRTTMDTGPEKVRLRYTAVPESFEISVTMTAAQRATFVAFYRETLRFGVEEFVWKHPATLVPKYCRFTAPYNFVSRGTDFILTISMEVLP